MKLQARVNHGRWLADCPQCGGAEIARPDRLFKCQSGYTGFNGEPVMCGFTAEIEFPNEKAVIESLLGSRSIQNQNWLPGETLAHLMKENTEHEGK